VQRWRALSDVPAGYGPSIVTIGVYDGVHRGHQVGVGRTVRTARERGAAAVVVTFSPHPMAVVHPAAVPPALSTLEHRLDLLEELGVDATLVLPFTVEVSRWSPEEFVQRVLVQRLGAVAVLVGEDFRFGHRAAGDVELLRRLGAEHGFDAEGITLAGDGDRWSSTRARALVLAGNVEAAAQVLGRPHRVEGDVVHGDHRGREIGYPTANLAVGSGVCIPADGVYAGWLIRSAVVPGAGSTSPTERLPGAISLGTNPTFDGVQRRVEIYVLDQDDLDLYGERVAVDFLARLRPTVRFDTAAALVAQMRVDVDRAREITAAEGSDQPCP
jgi:riboflavin kinase/FMN adenylyltransferase